LSTRGRLRTLVPSRLRREPSTRSELLIYCSGGIAKSTDTEPKLCWADEEKAALKLGAGSISLAFLDPAEPLPELSDSAALFGRDMLQIQLADAVVVDGRQRRGIGIGIEMLAARSCGTPLVAVVPPNSHYRREDLHFRGGNVTDYIHPHLVSLCDTVVDSFEEAGRWLCAHAATPPKGPGGDVIEAAIRTYRERLLSSDASMQSRTSGPIPRERRRLTPTPWFGARG
jgi:hypothetical protein